MSAALKPALVPGIHTTVRDLRAALEPHIGIAEWKSTIPILSHVLVTVGDGGAILTSNDLEQSATTVTAASADGGVATFCFPLKRMVDLVRQLPPDAEISLHPDAEEVLILCGNMTAAFDTIEATDFPDFKMEGLTHHFRLPASALSGLIEPAMHTISTEETRYYLNGIFLHVVATETGPMLRAVATDGHRLPRTETEAPAGTEGMPGVIVPRQTLGRLRRLLKRFRGDVEISLSDLRIAFRLGSSVLNSKLIDGTYPDYAKAIPAANPLTMHVDCASLVAAIGRIAAISRVNNTPVRFNVMKDAIDLSGVVPNIGRVCETVADGLVSYGGPEMTIGFNGRYLREMLQQMRTGVEISMLDPAAPTIFRDPGKPSEMFVLMPVRVS
ncbi:DNA polymerase III subunit beta [Rhizosaccharibacter radicis]|uniref:Beta sliding clamp n=1 Tax=Rhizosaccharibacter radicis TaxID=2782605 RepID=A0ABT1VY07_9PROT|nr:DNA polymerase III subunit beta [Acetobacteraceae bacterium KSS12]